MIYPFPEYRSEILSAPFGRPALLGRTSVDCCHSRGQVNKLLNFFWC